MIYCILQYVVLSEMIELTILIYSAGRKSNSEIANIDLFNFKEHDHELEIDQILQNLHSIHALGHRLAIFNSFCYTNRVNYRFRLDNGK